MPNTVIANICNSRVRPAADQWARSYWQAKLFLAEWSAGGYDTMIPDDPNTIIDDGAGEDGRRQITAQNVQHIVRICQIIVEFCETVDAERFDGLVPLTSIMVTQVNGNNLIGG